MLDLQVLIDRVNQVANDPDDGRLNDVTAQWSWTMQPVDAEDLPSALPLVAFFQGPERPSPRNGSPCHQAIQSSIGVILVCDKTQLPTFLPQLRQVLYQFQPDETHVALYLSDWGDQAASPLDIKGDYVWWQDWWLTEYPQI